MLEDSDSDYDTRVLEFDFPLPPGKATDFTRRHRLLKARLRVPEAGPILALYDALVTLCDPFTQPEEDYLLLSVEFLANILIALECIREHTTSSEDGLDGEEAPGPEPAPSPPSAECLRFTMSTRMFLLLRTLQGALNTRDELALRFVDNSEEHWLESLPLWTPMPELARDDYLLRLCYSMTCVLLVALHKLFQHPAEECNLARTPYLHYFFRLWKCYLNVILLGLEIDRRLEEKAGENGAGFQTPTVVHQALRGASQVRFVIAWILNQNPLLLYAQDSAVRSRLDMEVCDLLLIDFSQPLTRHCGGGLLVDMRLVTAALLILSLGSSYTVARPFKVTKETSGLTTEELERRRDQATPGLEFGDLLVDLEYDDKFDEDILYMFGYVYTPQEPAAPQPVSPAVGSDGGDADRRDIPRDANAQVTARFVQLLEAHEKALLEEQLDSQDFLAGWSHLRETLAYVTVTELEGDDQRRLGQAVLNSLARAIWTPGASRDITFDKVFLFLRTEATKEGIAETQNNIKSLVPIFAITNFELLLQNNYELAGFLIAELMMHSGSRRSILWFLGHDINLSASLVEFVYELLTGSIGSSRFEETYKFSRGGGGVLLSEAERPTLLHEFLTSSSLYLSATEGIDVGEGLEVVLSETIAEKQVLLLCLMINRLIEAGVIPLEPQHDILDYSNELRLLLFSWVGKLPEARELFFLFREVRVPPKTDNGLLTEEDEKDSLAELKGVLDSFASLSLEAISVKAEKPPLKDRFDRYTRRLENHLQAVQRGDVGADPATRTDDFRFFFTNFNALSRVEYFAEQAFQVFDRVVAGGPKTASGDVDSESSETFLNGEEDSDLKPSSKSPKKKAKKKRRGKKK